MYRDGGIGLDEHDRAVGQILIGETLIGQCETSIAKLSGGFVADRWRALRGVHDDYEQAWLQLDRAKKELGKRGINTMAYDDMRTNVAKTLVATKFGKKGSASHEVDRIALDDARRAIAELKLSVPNADWDAIATRTDKLVQDEQREIRRPWFKYAFVGVAAFAIAIFSWSRVVTPGHKVDERALMRAEIRNVAAHRDLRVILTAPITTKGCDVESASRFMEDLRKSGRRDDARAFGTKWIGQCGLQDEVYKWISNESLEHGVKRVAAEKRRAAKS